MERRTNLEQTPWKEEQTKRRHHGKKNKARAETMERRTNLEQTPWKEDQT